MGESKIIIVSNQKGGAGKSTLCMLLANFLVKHYHVSVGAIVDTDFQKSIIKKRDEDKKRLEGTAFASPYQVVRYSLANSRQIPAFIHQLRQTGMTYIIDTPGSLNDDGVFALLALADYILCPFNFSELSLSSTTEFLTFWHNLKEEAKQKTDFEIKTKMILVPCLKPAKVGTNAEKAIWEEIKSKLKSLYDVTPEIPHCADIMVRVDTMDITPAQLKVAGDTLNYIAEKIYNPNINNKDQNEEC